MKKEPCVWCLKLLTVADDFDPHKKRVACSWSCYHAEMYFQLFFKEYEKREMRNEKDMP